MQKSTKQKINITSPLSFHGYSLLTSWVFPSELPAGTLTCAALETSRLLVKGIGQPPYGEGSPGPSYTGVLTPVPPC